MAGRNFEAPHPGMSYNPSLEDHQALLNQVAAREENIIKKEKHLKRVTTKMFSKVTPEERDARHMMEMSAGLEELEDKAEQNDVENATGNTNNKLKSKQKGKVGETAAETEETQAEDNDAPYITLNAAVENKKKSRLTRNKELRQKELQKKHAEKKALKKQIADLHR